MSKRQGESLPRATALDGDGRRVVVSSGGLTRRGLGVLYPSTVVRREDALVVGYSFWCIVRRYMCEDRSTNLSPKTVLQHVLAYLWYIRVFLQDRTIFGVKLSINDHIVRLVHKNHIIRTCLMYQEVPRSLQS